MIFSDKFYQGDSTVSTFESPVASPLFRKKFTLTKVPQKFEVTLCGLGIYDLFVNGTRVTKGYVAPYRNNLNHNLYYDNYDLTTNIVQGENVIALTLGTGFLASVSDVWQFDKVSWKCAPKFALCAELNGEQIFDASSFVYESGPVLFNDYHCTEIIDANKEPHGWKDVDFDDSTWKQVTVATTPKGQKQLCKAEPVVAYNYQKPIKYWKGSRGYIYDFGTSATGTYTLHICGTAQQKITIGMGDAVSEGKIFNRNLYCGGLRSDFIEYVQRDTLILSGGNDTFEPRFTIKGFRFAEIIGITEQQAKQLDITFAMVSSGFDKAGEFSCNNDTINKLQQLVVNSNRSNFIYYPLDCPQREKNGWTGDAVLSCEQFLLNMDCANSLAVWLDNICKAQNENGQLPGVIPTDSWGYNWGNGPAWDKVLFELPYRIYVYTGDKSAIERCAPSMLKYLHYMETVRLPEGGFSYGLEDWLPVSVHTPLVDTDTITCKSICDIASSCFAVIGWDKESKYASDFAQSIKDDFAKNYYKCDVIDGIGTQCGFAMGLYYGMDTEQTKAVYLKKLDYAIRQSAEHMSFGVLGNRAFWRVVAENFGIDRALNIMLNSTYPSFASLLKMGATTLWEGFTSWDGDLTNVDKYLPNGEWSFNHHFWGDISAVFYRYLAGIRVDQPNVVNFAPMFAQSVTKVDSWHKFSQGKLIVAITHNNKTATANVTVPSGLTVNVTAPNGWTANVSTLHEGTNKVVFTLDKNYVPQQVKFGQLKNIID